MIFVLLRIWCPFGFLLGMDMFNILSEIIITLDYMNQSHDKFFNSNEIFFDELFFSLKAFRKMVMEQTLG